MSIEIPGWDRLEPTPADALILHIGLFKTGTTAVQSALNASRKSLRSHGIEFRGPVSWKYQPLRAVMAEKGPRWQGLHRAIATPTGRSMVSGENMCTFDDDQASEIISELAVGRPVRVLMTARPIADLVPSTWQQDLRQRSSTTGSYESWLTEVTQNNGAAGERFWARNDLVKLLERWGGLVGEENVIVVMTDKNDPERTLRVVERLTDLPLQTLALSQDGRSNPSRTFEEAEFLHTVYQKAAATLDQQQFRSLIRFGLTPAVVRSPVSPGSKIPLLRSAAEIFAAAGQQQATELAASGAVAIGDLQRLSDVSVPVVDSLTPPTEVPIDVAVAAVMGAISAMPATQSPATGRSGRLRSRLRRLGRRSDAN